MKAIKKILQATFVCYAATLFLGLNISLYSQESDINLSQIKEVTEGIYVLNFWGANITISSSNDGLLIVDTGYSNAAVKIDSIIKSELKKPIEYIVNTHFHYDHVGGNKYLAKDGAIIISHEATRERMLKEWKTPELPRGLKYPTIKPYGEDFLPDLCFSNSMKMHLDNEIVKLIPIADGHSDCDVVVYFQNANVIQTGDLFLTNGFPPFEGTIESYLNAVGEVIKLCDENTIVLPGHGPLSDRSGLISYRDMLSIGANSINKLKSQGKTIEEVLAAAPLDGLLSVKSYVPVEVFTYCVYTGISYK